MGRIRHRLCLKNLHFFRTISFDLNHRNVPETNGKTKADILLLLHKKIAKTGKINTQRSKWRHLQHVLSGALG